ncbi:MAG TPA: Gfo/Idh/MocA family oxidoreductase [Candidatus Limnocylindrales bacterium]
MRVGIVGCGDVNRLYLPGSARYEGIELAGCADRHPERAEALSGRGGFPALSVDALLADPGIELILNLTTAASHAEISRAAIAHGKHVYSEKPLATSLADAGAILDEAERRGVRVGAAPDTFLGSGLQAARAAIDGGGLGDVFAAVARVAHPKPETRNPNPAPGYARGSGPLLDVGPYYVTALVHLLGPVASVTALGRGRGVERRIEVGPRAGESFLPEVPTTVMATYTFESGALASLLATYDGSPLSAGGIEVYGSMGTLQIGDPNHFDKPVRRHLRETGRWEDMPLPIVVSGERGLGLAEMIAAIAAGRPHRASGALAYHVLDVLLATEASANEGRPIAVASTCARPEPLPDPRLGGDPFASVPPAR